MKALEKSNLIKGFVWLFSGAGLKIVIQMASMVILARILTPADFGLFAGAMAVMSIATVLATAGLTPSLVSTESFSAEFAKAAIVISLGTCVSIGGIVFFLSDLISLHFLDERLSQILQLMCVVFPFVGLKSVSSGLCQRKFKFKQIALINFSSYFLCSCVCAIVLAYAGYGYYSLVVGFILNQILSSVAFLYYEKLDFSPALRGGHIKEIFKYSKWYVSGLLVNNLASQVDNVLVGKSFGATELGLYSRGYQFLIAPAILIGGIVDKVLFPLISKKKREQHKNTFEFFVASYFAVMTLGSLLAIFCFSYIEYFVIYGLGEQWVDAVPVFQWLSLCIPYKAAQKIVGSYLKAQGNVRLNFYFQVFNLAITFVAVIFAIQYSIEMVAILIVLSSVLYNLVTMKFMSYFYKSSMVIIRKLVLIALLTCAVPLLSVLIEFPDIQLFAMNLCAFALIGLLGVKSLRVINYEEK